MCWYNNYVFILLGDKSFFLANCKMYMNKNIVSLLFLVMVFSKGLHAQYYTEPDSVSVKKNSIGLFITPIVSFAMDAYAPNPRYGVQYKRWLAPYKRLRIAYVHDKMLFDAPGDNLKDDNLLEITDKTITVFSESRKQWRNTLHIGLEWNESIKSNDAFFGLDIIAGYKQDHYQLKYAEYHYYTSPAGELQIDDYPSTLTTPYGYHYDYIQLGIAPILGWRFNIREHFEFAVNASPEFTVSLPAKSEWLGTRTPPQVQLAQNEIEFRIRVLEMVLSYRF